MLAHHRSVSLLLTSTDLPICSGLETVATLYQKDQQRFHLVLTEPWVRDREPAADGTDTLTLPQTTTPRLVWLELSPSRVIMTMQGNGYFSFRHLWERGVYGTSRYWLNDEDYLPGQALYLRNYARNLTLEGAPLPNFVRVDYELWANQLRLGHYVLHLDIRH